MSEESNNEEGSASGTGREGDDRQTGTFVVTHVDEGTAVLQDVNSGGVHTLAENPGLEVHEVLDATLAVQPPMEVVWTVAELRDRRTVDVEHSPEQPTQQARGLAAEQEVGELTTRERAGEGEVHVISVPPGRTEQAVADVVEDETTLTRAARLGVNRVEVRAAEGVLSVRYLP
ncbi:MAG: hypothetical protein ACI9CA_002336 [Natronomonas sp.]|jgi:hypothetical protein